MPHSTILTRITLTFIALLLVLNPLNQTLASGGQHWVYDELADFKQLILPLKQDAIKDGTISEAQFTAVHTQVFNESMLDLPIATENWVTLLKITIQLPAEDIASLLNMYVYSFSVDNHLQREDAVGGLVKLLSFNHLKAAASAEDPQASGILTDYMEISEKQKALVQIAYTEGLLDGSVHHTFRPHDPMTAAEAISMLYRTLTKLGPATNPELIRSTDDSHWLYPLIKEYQQKPDSHDEVNHLVAKWLAREMGTQLDSPISVDNWDTLLSVALNLQGTKITLPYTTALADQGYIRRDKAIVGIMKLWPEDPTDASQADYDAVTKVFTDTEQAFDLSKLALAYQAGIVQGYGDRTFRPQNLLTHGEAIALILRLNSPNQGTKTE
jgi:hypothetical protein